MLYVEKKTRQAHPSLVQLRTALTSAVSEVPSRLTSDEQRAMDLIRKLKTDYNRSFLFTSWKNDPVLNRFDLQEVIGSHV